MKSKIIDQWNHLFPIHTADRAKEIIRRISIGLYLVAIINIMIAFYTDDMSSALDAWVLVFSGITLQHCQSRTIACFIIFHAIISMGCGIYSEYIGIPTSRSIILNVIVIMLGVHAVIATHEYHQIRRSHINWRNAVLKTIQAIVYTFFFLMISSLGIVFPYLDLLLQIGGYPFALLLTLILPTVGTFLAFNGWLPFTHDEPACHYEL